MCVGEIEVVEAEGSEFVDVGDAGRVGGFCDGEVRDLSVNDRRIVGAGDGDGERVLLIGAALSVVDGDDVGEFDGFTSGEEVEREIACEGPIASVVDGEEVESVESGSAEWRSDH